MNPSSSKDLAEVEPQVDQAAAELWDITDQELADIRRSLEELGVRAQVGDRRPR